MDTSSILSVFLLLLHFSMTCARPDFLETMSSQFFGLNQNAEQSNQQQSNPNHLSQIYGSASQQVPKKFLPQAYSPLHLQHRHSPRRQESFTLPQQVQDQYPHQVQYQHSQQIQYQPLQQVHHQNGQQIQYQQAQQLQHQDGQQIQYQQVQQLQHPHPQQIQLHQPNQVEHHPQLPHPIYNGPPPVYGQQQGFGQLQPDVNETKTDGFPSDNQNHLKDHNQHTQQEVQKYQQIEYHQPEEVAVHYQNPPAAFVEYHPKHHAHVPHQYEYQHQHEHIPPPTVEVSGNHRPLLQIHTGNENAYHEPPAPVQYPYLPQIKHHHYTTHKPRRFQFSLNEPSPKYRVIDQHLKIPPVKFRFHFNPKVVIISDTKDPLEKKPQDDEHDLVPFPPPDAFSDPNAPPSINTQIVEHYPVKDHKHVAEHHIVEHVSGYSQGKHPYPVDHHVVDHSPAHKNTYDFSQGHTHQNPHRSLHHYEPTFKIKTKASIYTEPPPTIQTTTTTTASPTTSTTRITTSTTRTTTRRSTTIAQPTRRAQINARNPGYSVAFTERPTTPATKSPPIANTTSRLSIPRTNSERERESEGISERKDELSTSSETSSSTQTAPITESSYATPESNSHSLIATSTLSTTVKPDTTTTPMITEKPIFITSTTSSSASATIIQMLTSPSITTTSTTAAPLPSQPTPAEETTPHTTTLSSDTNEINIQKDAETPRRRPEPLFDELSNVERSGSISFENSESVKVIETTMLIDGKNETVKFYYITEPVKVPKSIFQKMAKKSTSSGFNVIKIRNKRFAHDNQQSIQNVLSQTVL